MQTKNFEFQKIRTVKEIIEINMLISRMSIKISFKIFIIKIFSLSRKKIYALTPLNCFFQILKN